MKTSGMAGYVLAAAVTGVALFAPQEVAKARFQLGLEEPGAAHITAMRDLHRRSDPLVPAGAAIFLGDSITQGMPVDAVAPLAVNYGIGWQTSAQLVESIALYGSLKRASVIFLNIGTNDMGHGRDMRKAFQQVLAALPGDVPLVWSAVVPGQPVVEITATNQIVRELCAARPGCVFVDTWAFLAAPDGKPRPGLYVDAVHPGPEGYRLWVAAMTAATRERTGRPRAARR